METLLEHIKNKGAELTGEEFRLYFRMIEEAYTEGSCFCFADGVERVLDGQQEALQNLESLELINYAQMQDTGTFLGYFIPFMDSVLEGAHES